MLTAVLIGGFVLIFYRIGEREYTRKGWLLALVSLSVSLGAGSTELGFLGILGSNLVLYLICLGYNLIVNQSPTSGF